MNSDPKGLKYHLMAVEQQNFYPSTLVKNHTYELIGPSIQGNPYNLSINLLIQHGSFKFEHLNVNDLKTSEQIQTFFNTDPLILSSEGIVIYLDDKPSWKLHHGHIHTDNPDKINEWRNNPYIPKELDVYKI